MSGSETVFVSKWSWSPGPNACGSGVLREKSQCAKVSDRHGEVSVNVVLANSMYAEKGR